MGECAGTGTGNPTNVLSEHAGVQDQDQGAVGVWEAPIRQSSQCGGCSAVPGSQRVSGWFLPFFLLWFPICFDHEKEEIVEEDQGSEDEMVGLGWYLFTKETLNYWKQLEHVMKYFRSEEDGSARLPNNFMSGFLEVG
jgi:hypothetical protein